MRVRIFALFTILILAITMTALAQTGEAPSNAELFLIATQIIVDATETAQAQSGQPNRTETLDPFQLTATGLVAQATLTGQASGATPVPVTGTVGNFELTATQLILEATRNAANSTNTQTTSDGNDNGADSPLSVTIIAFALLIFILVILGGAYILLTSRANQKQK